MGEVAGAITTVSVSQVPATPEVPSTIAFSVIPSKPGTFPSNSQSQLWEVLMLVDSEAAARVSDVAETVDYFG